jgi:predicted AlkP superfamily phosphohydrolase/phosphomutase
LLALLQFDAPALPLIERMLAAGRLPALGELRRRGTWETLDAKATILQSATYPTLCTGVDVTEHGLYSAYLWSPSEQRARFAHAFARPRTIWERLTEHGCRSLIVDPYLAWPPRTMAGAYLSGWHFKDRIAAQGRSMPGGLRRRLSRRHGRPPRLDDVYGRPRESALLSLQRQLVLAPRRTVAAVADLLARDSFDLVWVNFCVAHKGGHHLWDPASVLAEPPCGEAAEAFRHGLEAVYEAVDEAIGQTLDLLPDTADVIVFAPTGMGVNTSRADLLPGMLNSVLTGESPRSRGGSGHATPVWSLRSKVPASWRSGIARALPDRVVADLTTRLYLRADWQHVEAIAVPGENKGFVRLNLKGRECEGIVDPGRAEELLQAIADGLTSFRDPDGAPSIAEVTRMSELAEHHPYADRLPDLVVSWSDRPAAGVDRVSSPSFGEVERYGVGSGRSGNHTDDAWAILLPGASTVRELGRPPRLTDIAATACGLLGADATGLSGSPVLEAA